MISGFLLLNPEKSISIKKNIKYINRMILVLCSFGLCYSFIEATFTHGINNMLLVTKDAIINTLQGKSWAHMWFVYMMVGLYLILPILRKFVENASEEEIKLVLIGLLITGFVIPTINDLFKINITTFNITTPIFAFIFYFLAGYYVGNCKVFKSNIIYILGGIGIIGYLVLSILILKFESMTIPDYNIFLGLYSIMLFYIFSKSSIFKRENKIVDSIGKYSFGIYILHPLWLNILNKGFNIYPNILPTLIGELAFFTIAFVLSYITTAILKKLPIFNKIL